MALWGVKADIGADSSADLLRVQSADGTPAWIERAPAGSPFRWYVRWGDGICESTPMRSRPCGSLVGVLTALRRVLGVERGSAVRIAPHIDASIANAPSPDAASASTGSYDPAAAAASAASNAYEPCIGRSSSDRRVPVTVLTGFLGSGKTTLLARLLRHPDMGRTAVIVNEFGEIALDHDLIETSDESFVQLSTGCLCCRVRSDLVLTLTDLGARRRCGALPAFERVVIETSGLADPGPILHALMTDRALAEAYRLDSVVTTVDGIAGVDTFVRYPESVRQAAVADTLVITKTDLPQAANPAALETRLRRVNNDARIMRVARGEIAPASLFAASLSFPSLAGRASSAQFPSLTKEEANIELPSPSGRRAGDEGGGGSALARQETFYAELHQHTEGIVSHCLVRDQPLHAATLALFVSALADNCGPDLLRMKGIVRIAEQPEQPAVVHGVQHVYYPLEWLRRWPSTDERTRMVFIGRGLAPEWIEGLLDLLDEEVADTMDGVAHHFRSEGEARENRAEPHRAA